MKETYTVGYSSLAESMPSVAFRTEMLRAAAAEHPHLRLIVRDNDLDDDKARAHVREFADVPVDLAVIFHVNERIGAELGTPLLNKRIPTIAVDIPIPRTFYLGINNQEAGWLAGDELGRWIVENWGGQIDKALVLTDVRTLSIVRERTGYALKALMSHIQLADENVMYADGGHTRETAAISVQPVLKRWQDYSRIAIIALNDDTALGALDTARQLGMEEQIAVIGQDAQMIARDEIMLPNSHFIASTNYHLEAYGPRIIDLAVRILAGESVPRINYIPVTCFSKQHQA
jgi:ribose transport system substrate-binding protein